MKRHWSFRVCDPKYLNPIIAMILVLGIFAAVILDDASQVSRAGNFIIGTGVWMGMRQTFREGINRYKNAQDELPTIPGTGRWQQINVNYVNNITFSLGDAHLQIYGFIIVIIGSVIGSYGDIVFLHFFKK
jgi:hypothetical protein